MEYEYSDYNSFENLLLDNPENLKIWEDVSGSIISMPFHIKNSDQRGKIGEPIFDPVGTNNFIKNELNKKKDWIPNYKIIDKYRHLGTDVDFVSKGILVEVQFSNYPFLTNNLLRSEIFYKSEILPFKKKVEGLIIITKSGRIPASNSTLYYEQAKKLIDSLIAEGIFSIPIRLINLFTNEGICQICKTKYKESRYSRDIDEREIFSAKIISNKNNKLRIEVE